MLTHDIKEILASEAKTFYTRFKRECGGVSFLDKGKFYGVYEAKRLQGIISVMNLGKAIRVKTFMVRPDAQRRGIGGALLDFILYEGLSYSAFCTNKSESIFKSRGFEFDSKPGRVTRYMKRAQSVQNQAKAKGIILK